jgi:hypothetical protein
VDLSVQQRLSRGQRLSPVLRVIETAQLLLHEEPDPARVDRLTHALRRDRVLRNPPVVAPISSEAFGTSVAGADGKVLVLDGANRLTALREVGAPHAIAQVISYAEPEVILSTWRHFVAEEDGPALRDRMPERLRIRAVPVSDAGEAEDKLRRREAVAAIVDGQGATLLRPDADPAAEVDLLADLVALYRQTRRTYRIDSGDLEALTREYGRGTLVIFPSFRKEDIFLLAARGGRLPAGITRHVIPGRVLRLNVPLALLESSESTATKQRHFDAAMEQRWREHGVRYYAESTFLFDE